MRGAMVLLLLSLGACAADPQPGAVPAGVAPEGCAGDGWCWVRGRPLTVDRDRGSTYAVGPDGRFYLWQDGRWSASLVPTTRAITSAWIGVGGGADRWVSDDQGSLWHHDGARWTESPVEGSVGQLLGGTDGSLFAVAGREAGAHGSSLGGHLLRRDGDRWVEPAPPHEYCLPSGTFAVLGANDLWSAGLYCDAAGMTVKGAEVRHWDGASWQLAGDRIEGVNWYPSLRVVAGRLRLSAAGLREWNGARWQQVTFPAYPQALAAGEFAVFDGTDYLPVPKALACSEAVHLEDGRSLCFGHGQIWLHDQGTYAPTIEDRFATTQAASAWPRLPPELWAGDGTARAWGSGPSDVYRAAARTEPRLSHFDGQRWSVVLEDPYVADVDGRAGGEAWVAAWDTAYRVDHGAATKLLVPGVAPARQVVAVRALAPGVAVFAARKGVWLYDGNWSILYQPPPDREVTSVAGSDRADLFLTEHQTGRSNDTWLRHFDGATWTEVSVEGLTGWGTLRTAGRETWLYTSDLVVNLKTGTRYETSDSIDPWARLRIDSAGVWLITESQAMWHPR